MKKFFTKKAVLLSAFVLVAFGYANSQVVNTLTITAPTSVEGDYVALIVPGFGQQLTGTLSGEGTFADNSVSMDPCEDGVVGMSVQGKLAFMDRGNCEYGYKALAAENAGAVAVVICNNDTANPDLRPDNFGAGVVGDMVSIPTMAISYNDCQRIRMVAETGDVSFTLSYNCQPPNYGPEVIWGRNSGEGDFSGGLNDWTVESAGDTSWYYEATGFADGAFTNNNIQSPTACNGAMVFSSDLLDNGGTWTGTTGSGAGGCAAPCVGSLVSPTIDLTQYSDLDALFLEFHQSYRHFLSTQSLLLLSKNGGVTYPDTIVLNGDAVVNAAAVDETARVPLFGYESASSLTMKFEHTGNYYFWSVDDVRISNLPSFVDVQLNSNWYAAPVQWKTPSNQIAEQIFQIDMFNNGNLTADVVECTVNINNDQGTSVYSQTTDFNGLSIPGFDLGENEATTFPTTMNITDLTPGLYTGTYEVNASAAGVVDNNADNNVVDFSFVVTDNILANAPNQDDVDQFGLFAIEPATDGSIYSCPDASQCAPFYAAASHYYIRNSVDADGNELTFKNVRFGITEEEEVASGFVDVYVMRLPNGDSNLDQAIAPDERELVGFNSIVVDTVTNLALIDIPVWRADANGTYEGEAVVLESNSDYMIAFVTKPLAGAQIDLLSYPASSTTSTLGRNFYHFPAANAFMAAGSTRFPGTSLEPLVDGTTGDFESTTMGLWGINTLYNEVTVAPAISNVNDLNSELNITAYPNPTSDFLNLNLSLDNASDVKVEMFNIEGRKMIDKTWESLQNQTVVLNIAELPTGTYTLKVITADGFIAKNVIIE